jgi:hypothetical protein
MAQLNIKVILLHTCLVVLGAYAFIALGYIYDTPLAELYLETENLAAFMESAQGYGLASDRIKNFRMVQQFAPYVGALFAVVLSFIANRRKKYSLLNTLVVFILAGLLALTGLLDSNQIKGILFAPGRLVSNTVATIYTLNYLLLLGLCFWLAFSGRVIPAAETKTGI